MTRTSERICSDCGDTIIPRSSGAIGCAILNNKSTVCYQCAGERERCGMIRDGVACLYLTRAANGAWMIANWPATLAFAAYDVRVSNHRAFGWRKLSRTDAWFDGPDGRVWHAVVRGDMDLARCKATKRIARRKKASH